MNPQNTTHCVLVVEDNPAVLECLVAYLRFLGRAALVAGDGVEADRLLRKCGEEVGCALIDWNLPGVDGLETCRLLRAARPGLPCCLMTWATAGDWQPPEGFRRVLGKPFGVAQLRDCLAVMGGEEGELAAGLATHS